MFRLTPQPPVDYRLADQVVTIYHQTGAGSGFGCTCTVFRGAFFDWRKVERLAKAGSREATGFLLVLPSGWGGRPVWVPPGQYTGAAGTFTLAPQDKVLLGEGPHIGDRAGWAALLPGSTAGLAVVREVDPKYWRGSVTHVEGGG